MELIDIVMKAMEYTSTVVGVLVVLCLIYEKVWTWPLGVLFCVLSAPVMWYSDLYGYLTLTLVGFLPMNLYGWYYWLFGTEHKAELPITLTPATVWFIGVAFSVVAIFLLPYFFDLIVPNYFETAKYIYLDNSILVLSLVAMWFTAHKYIENWFIWFVVNVGTVTLYALSGLWGFMALYIVYIGMAIWGYLQWRQSMAENA
ncbi:MAG: nicotinamide riboside transporter PnuC [Gammaproteobacteria bacterium]|nr:nicotinamide riboside transporter PnuC [Gammaproteobacteria bacterium]